MFAFSFCLEELLQLAPSSHQNLLSQNIFFFKIFSFSKYFLFQNIAYLRFVWRNYYSWLLPRTRILYFTLLVCWMQILVCCLHLVCWISVCWMQALVCCLHLVCWIFLLHFARVLSSKCWNFFFFARIIPFLCNFSFFANFVSIFCSF